MSTQEWSRLYPWQMTHDIHGHITHCRILSQLMVNRRGWGGGVSTVGLQGGSGWRKGCYWNVRTYLYISSHHIWHLTLLTTKTCTINYYALFYFFLIFKFGYKVGIGKHSRELCYSYTLILLSAMPMNMKATIKVPFSVNSKHSAVKLCTTCSSDTVENNSCRHLQNMTTEWTAVICSRWSQTEPQTSVLDDFKLIHRHLHQTVRHAPKYF